MTLESRSASLWISLVLFVCLMRLALCAQETSRQELRKIARNPFADVIKVPLVADIYLDAGSYHRTGSDLQIQPVFPIRISAGWLLVPRLMATAVNYVPSLTQPSGGRLGLGDTVSTLFFTPADASGLIWGIGPALLIPTATSSELGAGRWALGPSFVVLSQPKWGSVGILVQNLWSFAGSAKRGPVNQMQLNPAFSYNLGHSWYLTTSPTWSADWTQPASERWLVPVGGGLGRTFKLGRKPVDANLTLYRNVVRPANQPSPKWQVTVQITFLWTKHGPS